MTTALLFGLPLAPLYAAIAQVESDQGATSDNTYQIRVIYVRDVNRIHPATTFTEEDRMDDNKAEEMMLYYWQFYGARYREETGCAVTYEVLARIHNGGPRGWAKSSTRAYWKRVKRELDKAKGGAK